MENVPFIVFTGGYRALGTGGGAGLKQGGYGGQGAYGTSVQPPIKPSQTSCYLPDWLHVA